MGEAAYFCIYIIASWVNTSDLCSIRRFQRRTATLSKTKILKNQCPRRIVTVIVKFGCCCCLIVVCWEDPGVFEREWIFGCGCVFSFAGVFKWQARLKGDEWSNSASVLGDYPRMERQATMYNSETPCLHGMKENWNWTRFLATGNITGLYDGWAELHVHWDSDVFKKNKKNKNTIPFHKHQVIHQQQYFSFSSVTQIPLRIKEKKKKTFFEFFFCCFLFWFQ